MTREPWQITREMFLSFDEVGALLQHIRGRDAEATAAEQSAALNDRLIVEILLFSGLRNSELCRLAVRDAPPVVEGALQVRGTPREDRTVYIPQHLSNLIGRYVSKVRGLPSSGSTSSGRIRREELDLPLLLNERGRAYERTGLYRRVVRILTDAGLGERASVQLLRHTYGYLAYARTGGNLLFVQRQLGHAHPMVTSIYAQFVDESYAALADLTAGAAVLTPPVAPTPGARTAKKPRSAQSDRQSSETTGITKSKRNRHA